MITLSRKVTARFEGEMKQEDTGAAALVPVNVEKEGVAMAGARLMRVRAGSGEEKVLVLSLFL